MIAMQNQQMSMLGSVPQMAPVPGQSVYPPQFTYAPRQHDSFQAGLGLSGGMFNSVGPGAGGLAAGAGTAQLAGMIGGMGAGMLGMNRLSSGLSAVSGSRLLGGLTRLDPMNSMIMGGMGAIGTAYTAGAAGGAGIMGGMGALASGAGLRAIGAGMFGTAGLMNPIALAGMAAMPAMKMMQQGADQYSQTRQMLNAYNTSANPMSSTGRGFSSQQAANITTTMRGINAEDPFVNFKDVSSMMQRFNEFGMTQGSRDVTEVSKKFKAMATAVKDMAKTLGTTIDEAAQMFGQMRATGFYKGTDIVGNTNLLKMMQGQGVSGRAMLGAQMQGGGITRAAGLGTTPGAKAVGSMAGMLAGARMTGSVSSEEMMNATGAGTPEEALTQYATQMAGGMTQFFTQSTTGAALTAALGSVNEHGEFTGELDEGLMSQMRSGSININNLVQSGRKRLTNKNSQLSFKQKGADVAGSMLGEDPTEAFGLIMKSIAGDKFSQMDPENLIALLTERMTGLDRKTAESMVKLVREGAKVRSETTAIMNREAAQKIYEVDLAQNRTFEGLKTKLLGGAADRVVRPFEQMGQNLSQGIGEDYQRLVDSIPGLKVTRIGSDEELRRQAILSEYGGTANVGVRTGGSLGVTQGLVSAGMSRENADKEQVSLLSTGSMSGSAQAALSGQQPTDQFIAQFQQMIASGELDKGLMSNGSDAVFKGSGAVAYNIAAGPGALVSTIPRAMGLGGYTMQEYARKGPKERAALAAALAKGGYTDLARQTAALGEGTSEESLSDAKERLTRGLSTIMTGDAGGAFDITDYGKAETELDKLMSAGGQGAVAQIAGTFDRKKFDEAMATASRTTKGGAEGRAAAMRKLGAKGSDAELAAAADFYSHTRRYGPDEAEDFSFMKDAFLGMQGGMDYLNISTAMASGVQGMGVKDKAGAEFKALAAAASTTAGGGDIRLYQEATEDFYKKLENDGVGLGDVAKMYGTYGKTAASVLGRRKEIQRSSSVSDLKDRLGITEEQFKAMKIDLSDDELNSDEIGKIVKQDTLAAARGANISAGSVISASTEETQLAIAAEYAKLAKSTDALAGTVLQIQHDQQAKGSAAQTAVPTPDGGAPH